MNFVNKSSDIDFKDFIGQKVIEISPVGLELVNIKFDGGSLNVECSWRLRNKSDIVVGITERDGTDFISIIKDNLQHKPITNIYHFKTGDLTLEIQNQYYFDLFADSSAFEHYQLYRGESLFLLGR
ncbi:hypothetical protein [Paenibacillus sedimenti]|uniref:Uncharacterized protein n=1 Tax=Paenibacillus sedimenti TaxID=2770274 RepID=A0A926KV35_9BACL|nr:hypothetical protein [Paenibacillus sedimenti]MBD0384737.1 hypothetical protein [Paenibacillus sedimenti]